MLVAAVASGCVYLLNTLGRVSCIIDINNVDIRSYRRCNVSSNFYTQECCLVARKTSLISIYFIKNTRGLFAEAFPKVIASEHACECVIIQSMRGSICYNTYMWNTR